VLKQYQSGTEWIPTDWLQIFKTKTIDGKRVNRAYFGQRGPKGFEHPRSWAEMGISTDGDDSVAAHEFGHFAQWAIPDVLKIEKEFYDRRTKDSRDKRKDGGIFREGNFLRPYMGKRYADGSYELITTGIQAIVSGGKYADLTKDEEMYNFILGMLAGVK
jgi:hypothetical protein